MADRTFPTHFTPRQLEVMRDLVRRAQSSRDSGKVEDIELHHLGYKLDDYCRNARSAEQLRRVGG